MRAPRGGHHHAGGTAPGAGRSGLHEAPTRRDAKARGIAPGAGPTEFHQAPTGRDAKARGIAPGAGPTEFHQAPTGRDAKARAPPLEPVRPRFTKPQRGGLTEGPALNSPPWGCTATRAGPT